jgi:NAD dependent epimerase/dehydratase
MNIGVNESMNQCVNESMICVVTGAGGFIGSHLTELLLENGYHVRALVHYNALGLRGHLEEVVDNARASRAAWLGENRLEIVAGDVQDARCMRELVAGCDVIFHLAALIGIPYSYTAPQSYVNVNIHGTLNILEACRLEKTPRLIHTSTSETLGTARYTPQDEIHPLQAQSPYAATKIAADKLVESYNLSFGLPAVILRPFNTYGPRQSSRAVIPTILSQILSPECPEIRLGSLTPVRDFTYVRDTARAFMMISGAPLETVIGKLYHLGSGAGISIGELADLAMEVTGIEKPVRETPERIRPESSEVQLLTSNNRRIRDDVGWEPQVNLADGLRKTAEWILRHPTLFRPDEYTV